MKKLFKDVFSEHKNHPTSELQSNFRRASAGPLEQPPNQQVNRRSSIQAPPISDVIRYRYHHGTNLGSVFLLEKWLTGCMFNDKVKGSSELAAVEAWVKQEGMPEAKKRFERHWVEYLSDSDLDWLRDVARCTTIRLPIGYWTLGADFCHGTDFEKVAPVYDGCWTIVRELVNHCLVRGIGVLLDLHGLPGGANPQDHSGTNSGKANMWHTKSNRDLATKCVIFLVNQARSMDGVAGIQIINEAEYDAKHLYDWYDEVLEECSHVDPTVPIYISDAWDLNKALEWARPRNTLRFGNVNPIVIDTHCYWCFDDRDKKKSPQDISKEALYKLSELDGKDGSVVDHGAAQAIVGEYSCVLAEDSWGKGGGVPKDELVREFGNAQSQRYQQRAGGSFFWTYRMDWMPGGEWGFKQMVEAKAIVPPKSLMLSLEDVQERIRNAKAVKDDRKQQAYGAHCHYWDSNHPGEYEHNRFETGWDIGYKDAMYVFAARAHQGLQGADKIGMMDMWVLKRLRDSDQTGHFVWEFEQGLRQGIKHFYEVADV